MIITDKEAEKLHAPCAPREASFDPPPDYTELDVLEAHAAPASAPPRLRRIRYLILTAAALNLAFLCLIRPLHHAAFDFHVARTRRPDSVPTTEIRWKACGKGTSKKEYACANVTVPLDWRSYGQTDNRTAVIAVTKRFATQPDEKLGTLFLNPGGPGGSGTNFVYRGGESLDKVFKGRYDLVGFDPRGVNLTDPLTKCFDSEYAADLYAAADYHDSFDLPSSLHHHSDSLYTSLHRQVSFSTAGFRAGAASCLAESGDVLAYAGTEAVVKDLEYMAGLVDGDGRVNLAGFSYGTVIAQYLVAILPREKIGKMWIDGVVNPDVWSGSPAEIVAEGLDNIDDVTRSFAEACSGAGDRCALSHLSSTEILRKIDEDLIDGLYDDPQPVSGLSLPPHVGVAAASDARRLVFSNAYRIAGFPKTAEILASAFKANYTPMMEAVGDRVDPSDVTKKDGGDFAVYAIACSDVSPVAKNFSTTDLTDAVLETMRRYGARSGDGFWSLGLCAFWPIPSRSRFPGPFSLPDDALDTPALVVSNTYDPVTSLASGKRARARLGNNARLVQQDGVGHCSINQVSYCTIKIVQDYFLEGKVPEANHTLCPVDQHPFQPFDPSSAARGLFLTGGESTKEVAETLRAWQALGSGFEGRRRPGQLLPRNVR